MEKACSRLTRRGRRSATATAVFLATVMLLAACGSDPSPSADDTTTTSSETTTTITTTLADTTTSSSTARSTTTTTSKPKVAYPSGGPRGAVFPPDTPAYAMLSEGRCRDLKNVVESGWGQVDLELRYLYLAAAQACLGEWDGALLNYERLKALSPDFSDDSCSQSDTCPLCLRLVYDWVADLVAKRRQNPQFSPQFVRGTGPNPCPPTTTSSSSSSTTTTTARTSTSRG